MPASHVKRLPIVSIVAHTVGCVGLPPRTADFSQFRAAEKLTFTDYGPPQGVGEAKRSVTLSDPQAIAAVTAFFESRAANWRPMLVTAPGTQFRW